MYSASRATPVRQSTSVPKTSKNSALTPPTGSVRPATRLAVASPSSGEPKTAPLAAKLQLLRIKSRRAGLLIRAGGSYHHKVRDCGIAAGRRVGGRVKNRKIAAKIENAASDTNAGV